MSILTKKRRILAVHVTDIMRVAIVSIDTAIHIERIIEDFDPNMQLPPVDGSVLVLGDKYAFLYVNDQPLHSDNLERFRREHGLTDDQALGYLNISKSRALAIWPIEQQLEALLKSTPLPKPISATHQGITTYYAYQRIYFSSEEFQQERKGNFGIKTVIIYIGSNYISALAIQHEVPLVAAYLDIREFVEQLILDSIASAVPATAAKTDSETTLEELERNQTKQSPSSPSIEDVRKNPTLFAIREIYNEILERTGWNTIQKLYLHGNCDAELVKVCNPLATTVELFNPLPGYDLSALSDNERRLAIDEGHKYFLPVFAAIMREENMGPDLLSESSELSSEFHDESNLYQESTAIGQLVNTAKVKLDALSPILLSQRNAIISSLTIAAVVVGYLLISFYREDTRIQAALVQEQARADSLKEIRTKYETFNNRKNLINTRINAIEQVRGQQLLSSTIIEQIDRAIPKGVTLTELTVDSDNVTCTGYTIDRLAVRTLIGNLTSSRQFTDLLPLYTDKAGSENSVFTLKLKFIGSVPKPSTNVLTAN